MEEEAMASEGDTSLVHEGNHMSVYTNGQVSSEQPDALEQHQNILEVTGTNKLKEDSPIVVVKKTVSLRMQSTIVNGVPLKSTESFEDTVAAEMEKVPILLPMKGPENTAVAADDERLIQEAELIAVEKTPVSSQMEPTFDSGVAEGNEEEEIPGEASVSERAEDVLDSQEREHVLDPAEVADHKEDEKALDWREPIEESSRMVIEERPASLHMEHVLNKEGNTEVQEPIEEASAVAVESEPRVCDYHPVLEETLEDENVDNSSVEAEYEPAIMLIRKKADNDGEGETKTDTKEMIAEESPLVVEKRPASLHMEAVFEHKEDEEVREPIEEAPHEIIEKRPVSLHMEQVFNEEGSVEVQEPIEEASAVAVESEPRVCDYHPMLEETVEDENVDGNSVEVEYEPAATTPENKEETKTETKETITEESPLVVEKRPASLHMEAKFDHKKEEEVRKPIEEAPHEITEKRPVSLHMEQMFNEEGSVEVQEPIEEASAVAVESEPRLFHYHPMLEEMAEDKNVHDNSVEVKYEPVASKADKKEESKTETETRETVAEESPLVVEKRPVSLHIEAAFDHNEDVKEPIEEDPPQIIEKRPVSLHMENMFGENVANEVQEPIEEASAVAVESEPRICDYHPMLEETVEDENVDGNSVEVEYEPAATTPENEEETVSETREMIAEESPFVVEKRPASLHLEAVFEHKEEGEVKEPIEEAPLEIIEKRPVSLHMEQVFNEEGSVKVQEPIEEASAVAVESEPRVCDYHPMLEENVEDENVDGNSVEVEYEPAARTPENEEKTVSETKEMIAEESPFVVEKRPASLHIEAVFEHKEEGEVKEPIEEAPLEIIEKRPVSLHMEQVFNEEGSVKVQEPIEEASAVVVESEPRVCDYHPMLEETVEDETVDGNSVEVEYEPAATKSEEETETDVKDAITEESPLVVEKRPPSLHMEAVVDQKEEEEGKEPIEEALLEITEKRPVSLHIDDVFNEEGSVEVQEPIEEASAVSVETDPRLFHYHPMLEEKVEDKKVDEKSVEVEYEPAAAKREREEETETDTRETIAEESPLVIETRPASLHIEALVDHEEDRAGEVGKPKEETPQIVVKKTPAATLHRDDIPDEASEKKGYDDQVTGLKNPITEAELVVVEKKPATLHTKVLIEGASPEDEPVEDSREGSDVTVESLLVNIESIIDKPSPEHTDIPQAEKTKEVEDSVQETVAPAVDRKALEFHNELLQMVETEEEKPGETTLEVDVEENQVRETEILDDEVQVPELKGNEVQESKRSEVITKTEVISTVTINQRTGDETTQEMQTNVVQTTYEKKTMEVTSASTSFDPNTSTTEETFASTSFTKLHQYGRDDDEELLRHVLRKRLSAPEVLPEKENDGSAPLAASEDRGILESQEQFAFADNSRKKDSTPTNKPQVLGTAPSGTEPYEDVPGEEKLIADAPGETEVGVDDSVENEEGADESLPVLLLLTPEEEKSDHEKERKKGKTSGPSSPQCKCCSLM